MEQLSGSLQNYHGSEFATCNGYTIYQFDNNYGGVYFLAIPQEQVKNYNLFVGFPTKDFRNIPRSEILEQIKSVNDMLFALRKDTVYLIPAIPTEELEQAAQRQDDQKFRKILNEKIQPMIYDTYNRLTADKDRGTSVDQMIKIVEQSETDYRFVQWLKGNTYNIKNGITLDQLKKHYYSRFSMGKRPNDYKNVMKDPLNEKIMTPDGEVLAYDIDKQNDEAMAYSEEKKNAKVRTLSKPNNPYGGSYGYINAVKMTMILTVAVTIALIISFLLIKTRM